MRKPALLTAAAICLACIPIRAQIPASFVPNLPRMPVPADSSRPERAPAAERSEGVFRAGGVAEIVGGLLLIPLGLAVTAANSFEECEENDGIMGSWNVGPCSESGPDQGGQLFGGAVSVGGLVMVVDGLRRVSGPAR